MYLGRKVNWSISTYPDFIKFKGDRDAAALPMSVSPFSSCAAGKNSFVPWPRFWASKMCGGIVCRSKSPGVDLRIPTICSELWLTTGVPFTLSK